MQDIQERIDQFIAALRRGINEWEANPDSVISPDIIRFYRTMIVFLDKERNNPKIESFLEQTFGPGKVQMEIAVDDLDEIDPHHLVHQPTGAALIMKERQRQIEIEGFNAVHDRHHTPQVLCRAAATYALYNDADPFVASAARCLWPWSQDWHKPKDHLRNLVRAGALIAAAIDRLLAEENNN